MACTSDVIWLPIGARRTRVRMILVGRRPIVTGIGRRGRHGRRERTGSQIGMTAGLGWTRTVREGACLNMQVLLQLSSKFSNVLGVGTFASTTLGPATIAAFSRTISRVVPGLGFGRARSNGEESIGSGGGCFNSRVSRRKS